jgi:hypothetical protein
MTRKLVVTLVLGAAIAAGTISIATSREPGIAGTEPVVAGAGSVPPAVTVPRPVNPELLSPMHREVQALLETERQQIDALSGRLAAASHESRLALHLEIEQVKKAGQRGVFEIQLRYAREAGHAETVQQLEAVIAHLDQPRAARADGETLLERFQRGQLPAPVRSN